MSSSSTFRSQLNGMQGNCSPNNWGCWHTSVQKSITLYMLRFAEMLRILQCSTMGYRLVLSIRRLPRNESSLKYHKNWTKCWQKLFLCGFPWICCSVCSKIGFLQYWKNNQQNRVFTIWKNIQKNIVVSWFGTGCWIAGHVSQVGILKSLLRLRKQARRDFPSYK